MSEVWLWGCLTAFTVRAAPNADQWRLHEFLCAELDEKTVGGWIQAALLFVGTFAVALAVHDLLASFGLMPTLSHETK